MRPPEPYWSGRPALPMGSWRHLGPSCCQGPFLGLWYCCSQGLCWCSQPMLPQDDIGIMHVEICLPSWALAWARHWACSSLDAAAGELTLPTMERWLHPSPGHRRAGSTSCLRGGSPSGQDWPASLPPRPTSWAVGWSTRTSTPSIHEEIDCAEWQLQDPHDSGQ